MKNVALTFIIVFSLGIFNTKIYAQLHETPSCGQNFELNWTTSTSSVDHYWPPGQMSNTYNNVDGSGTNIEITFTGETSTLGFWAGQTPKVGTQSSYLYKGIDLLSNGFSGTGITCTITFSKPIYALSFDIHHVNKWGTNGDKYTFTGTDTDGNTIYPKFTNSTYPTYTSDSNTGIVNAFSNLTTGGNSIIGVNYSDPNYIKSISFLWEDCDTCDHYLPHATGIGNFSFCTPQTLDFDGIDDYISQDPFLGDKTDVTMMSWIKLDNGFNGGDIMGQRNFRLYVDSEKKLKAFIKTNTGLDINSSDLDNVSLKENLWYHVALSFDSTTGTTTLYLNGKIISSYTDNSLIGTAINNTSDWNSNHDFEIGRNTEFDNNYFEGSIYESRVYQKALSLNQLHQQINQGIENNYGNIKGSVIPKDIEGLLWSDLILYYKMGIIDTGYTPDDSDSEANGRLHNMSTFQEYTAPLPYVTNITSNGNWHDPSNWLHGNVWDITNNVSPHSIIQVKGNLEANTDMASLGLLIDKGSVLKVNQNSGLYNSWYLKLDGTLDLEGKSQLIQTKNSTIDETSSGILEKDLQGIADEYTYDYWASPVGKSGASTTNNYTVKDVFTNVQFLTAGYDGGVNPVSIADYWIWKFNNNLSDNYSSWQHVRSSGELIPGEGFTMKGPGTGSFSEEQNYTLQGKPNNGEINLTVYAGNNYLVGNPYPSALDAIQFINDNKSTLSDEGATNGTLYFWKHWGGGSHVASEYHGGYATYSLSGGVPAISKNASNNGISTEDSASDIPSRYIPVGQGFYTTAETNGAIRFNNEQRVLHVEAGNVTVGKANEITKNVVSTSDDSRMKLRIGFNSVNTLQRQLLITVDENASFGYDWGYDAPYLDVQMEDMYWMINNDKYVIQGIDSIEESTIIPLGVHTKNDGLNIIALDKIENATAGLNVYLHDKTLNNYYDLIESNYEVYLLAGEYLDRFEITFSESSILNIEDFNNQSLYAYFSNEKESIIIHNPLLLNIESMQMHNILGQSIFESNTSSNKNYLEYGMYEIKTGVYSIKLTTPKGIISKKVLVN